jgi:hypothetical protein
MPTTRTGDPAKSTFAQIEHLAMLSRKSLKIGDIPRAIGQIEGCIRLVHDLRNSKEKRRLLLACAVSDHWRLGYCYAALGPGHHAHALGHLNVVRRYCLLIRKKRRLELDESTTVVLCRALAATARICNLQGRHELALLRAEEGLDALFGNEELQGPAADLVQMLCFAARGDALRGLGHSGEIVVRHYEQVLLHYRRYVSDAGVCAERKRLIRSTGDCLPWSRDRLHPELYLDQGAKALAEMRGELAAPMRHLADRIVKDCCFWSDTAY